MITLLLNIDSTIPNLALKKLEIYHVSKGDEIVWDMPMMLNQVDKAYASVVFSKNRHIAENYLGLNPDLIVGGSGWDLSIKLPDEIEAIKPHMNWGFTTRGCIRHCPFCVVPEKEGNVHIVGDLPDLWDGKSRLVTVMDNNILAIPEQFYKVCQQARENKIRLDFNQGVDHRLITPQIAQVMADTHHVEYHLAYDHPSYRQSVKRAIRMLYDVGIKRSTWYVLVGYNTTPEQDLFRLNYLRRTNQNAYVQRYGDCYSKPFYIQLARWANNHSWFHGVTWEEFCGRNKVSELLK